MASLWKSVICGALGGLAGALAMHQCRIIWERRPAASSASGIFGFDEEADLNAVDQLWSRLALPALSREEALRMALLMHYAFGALSGGAYAVIGEKYPALRAGYGLMFGASLWLVGDELAISMSGLSHPGRKTRSSHLSAMAVHLLFGTITEFGRKSLMEST